MWSFQSVVDLESILGPWGPGLCLSLIRILFSLTHHNRIGIWILWRLLNRISIRPKKHFNFLIFEIDFLRRAIWKPRQIILGPSGGEILIGWFKNCFCLACVYMAMDLVILIWPLWTIGNPTAGQAPMWFFKKRIRHR